MEGNTNLQATLRAIDSRLSRRLTKAQHPMADLAQQCLLVAEYHHSKPALLAFNHQLPPELALNLRIQLGGHLVGNQQSSAGIEGAQQRDAGQLTT